MAIGVYQIAILTGIPGHPYVLPSRFQGHLAAANQDAGRFTVRQHASIHISETGITTSSNRSSFSSRQILGAAPTQTTCS